MNFIRQTDFLKTRYGWLSDDSGLLLPNLLNPKNTHEYSSWTSREISTTLAEYSFRDATPARLNNLPEGSAVTLTLYGLEEITSLNMLNPGICDSKTRETVTSAHLLFKGVSTDAVEALKKYPWKVEE